jgi:hypothetical protein
MAESRWWELLADEMSEHGIAPTEMEALAWAGRNGDEIAARMADELARRAEWGE